MKIFSKVFKKTTKTRLLFFLFADIVFITISIFLAFFIRFEGKIPSQYFRGIIPEMILLSLIFSLPTFYFFRLYSFSWSYVSIQELISLIKALTLSLTFFSTFLFIFRDDPKLAGLPRSTLFISYFLIIFFSGGIRFSKRIYLQLLQGKIKEEKNKTLIVGAGDAGEQILRNILVSKNSSYYQLVL